MMSINAQFSSQSVSIIQVVPCFGGTDKSQKTKTKYEY